MLHPACSSFACDWWLEHWRAFFWVSLSMNVKLSQPALLSQHERVCLLTVCAADVHAL